jgi:hypothetical protein
MLPLPRTIGANDAALGELVASEFRWQALRMPPICRLLLLERGDPSSVEPEDLMGELSLSDDDLVDIRSALDTKGNLAMLHTKEALPPDGCRRLREAVGAEIQQKADTVDGAPDYQLNLSRERLDAIIGPAAAAALWSIPPAFSDLVGTRFPEQSRDLDLDVSNAEIFLRRYTAATRPWNPFHTDSSAMTINVALDADCSYEGGELLGCYDGSIQVISRAEGDATAHASSLLHGVAQMTAGVRHSLIIFIGEARADVPAGLAVDDASRHAEARALALLMSNEAFLSRCKAVLGGEESVAALHSQFARLLAIVEARFLCVERQQRAVGTLVCGVAQHYGAPHLRPIQLEERLSSGQGDAACYSLRALLGYCMELGLETPPQIEQQSESSDSEGDDADT